MANFAFVRGTDIQHNRIAVQNGVGHCFDTRVGNRFDSRAHGFAHLLCCRSTQKDKAQHQQRATRYRSAGQRIEIRNGPQNQGSRAHTGQTPLREEKGEKREAQR